MWDRLTLGWQFFRAHSTAQFVAIILGLAIFSLAAPLVTRAQNNDDAERKVSASEQIFEAAMAHFNTKNYDQSLKSFHALAREGHPEALAMLGVHYFHGHGVPRDAARAATWFYKSAQKGAPNGQIAFGTLYMNGTGVAKDLVAAYKWFLIAESAGVEDISAEAMRLRLGLRNSMTAAEINRAERAAQTWREQKPDIAPLPGPQ